MADKNIGILVLGDVHLDTFILPQSPAEKRSQEPRMTWEADGNSWRHRRKGGAWLLRDIVREAVDNLAPKGLQTTVEPDDQNDPSAPTDLDLRMDQLFLNAAVILDLFRKKKGARTDDKEAVYRIKTFLGWVHNISFKAQQYREALNAYLKSLQDVNKPHDILVLHDRNSDFRRLAMDAALKQVLRSQLDDTKTWIVWQMYSPLASGNLWELFQENKSWLTRTIAVVKAECLRTEGANLPEYISLERESEHFLTSLERIPRLRALAKVGHLVVHFHRQGVLHYDRKRGLRKSCYYCPRILDDPASPELGIMLGYTSILVGAVVRGIAWSIHQSEARTVTDGIVDGLKQGVVLDHLYYKNGYGPELSAVDVADTELWVQPYRQLFKDLGTAEDVHWEKDWNTYHVGALELRRSPHGGRLRSGHLRGWSRIESFIDRYGEEKRGAAVDYPELTGLDIVRWGLDGVADKEIPRQDLGVTPGTPPHTIDCPYEIHGKIKTAFRDEIESFANIRRVMQKYLATEDWKNPLSIAVFGPPGSGKGFTIQQILENVDPDIAKRPLEYNVAQFSEPKDLETAFHQAQDRVVAGERPLLIFDEFDAEELKWLKFFLAPMQDGKFKSGPATYRIGRAILVFAGGVCHTWDQFIQYDKDRFRVAKGLDFISRLRGHLNILGINDSERSEPAAGKSGVSPVLLFRRAVLLRSLLENHLQQIIDRNTGEARIDRGVVRAFLKISSYRHGVRSMRAIIEMAHVSPRGRFTKSSLAAPDQLDMHVEASAFLDWVSSSDVP